MTRNADRSKVEYGQASQKKGKMSRGRKTSSQIRKQKRKKKQRYHRRGKKKKKKKKPHAKKQTTRKRRWTNQAKILNLQRNE